MTSINLKYITKDVDRHGNVRLYFRKRGHKKVRLQGPITSDEFLAAYSKLLSETSGLEPQVTIRPHKDTFDWLCVEFFKHCDNYKDSSDGWKIICQRNLELVTTKYGKAKYKELNRGRLLKIRDELKDTPNGKNTLIKVIRVVFSWALSRELVDINPAVGITKIKTKSHTVTITQDEIIKFINHHGKDSKAYLGIVLGITTGLRVSDLARLGKAHRYGNNIIITPGKTRRKTAVTVELPLGPELMAALEAIPSSNLVYLTKSNGVPYTIKGLANRYKKWFVEAGIGHCSVHSLRRGAATIAAEGGATENDLKAIFGWTTSDQPTIYTQAANRRKLAAKATSLLKVPTTK